MTMRADRAAAQCGQPLPFREEGVTCKRDGRSPRDGKMAETFCFAYRRISDLIFCFRLSVAASSLRKCRSRISSKTQSSRKTQVAQSPSVAPRQLPLGGSLWLCVFFPCAAEEFSACFRRFPNNPSPALRPPPLPQGSYEFVRIFLCHKIAAAVLHQTKRTPDRIAIGGW